MAPQRFISICLICLIFSLFTSASAVKLQDILSLSKARFGHSFLAEDDYFDEILHGRRIRDPEKHKRQKDCLCIDHLRDPHCGSDFKTYDNGCYFLCAQKRTRGLKLLAWDACENLSDEDSNSVE